MFYVFYYPKRKHYNMEKITCENLRMACEVAKALRNTHQGDFSAVLYRFKGYEYKSFRIYHSYPTPEQW